MLKLDSSSPERQAHLQGQQQGLYVYLATAAYRFLRQPFGLRESLQVALQHLP